jgi:hypothetical protein
MRVRECAPLCLVEGPSLGEDRRGWAWTAARDPTMQRRDAVRKAAHLAGHHLRQCA